jgi:SulP family sulfate permease
MIKLMGHLAFEMIVSVEEKIRALIDNDTFCQSPIKFLILDLLHVTGLDKSAGEALNTISRLRNEKNILLILRSTYEGS